MWRRVCTSPSALGSPAQSSAYTYRNLGIAQNCVRPEARFEPRSYGFRPGRSCQDAIRVIHTSCKGSHAKRVWALDADLAAAFDRINHDYLLGAIGGFPARGMIAAWLKAGVFEPGKGFAPSSEGTP